MNLSDVFNACSIYFLKISIDKERPYIYNTKVQVRVSTLWSGLMKIDLTNLFNGSKNEISINHSFDMSDLIYSSYTPIKDAVTVKGKLFSKADVVYLDINIAFTFNGFCDRCAEEIVKNFSFSVKKIVVEELQNENDDDNYIVVKNRVLDLQELVNEEVSLNLPTKILCSDDCKGLCPQCGANLNVSKCDCKKDVDPRLSALLQLLDEE